MINKSRVRAGIAAAGRGRNRAARVVVLILLVVATPSVLHWTAGLDPLSISAAIGAYPAAPLAFLGLHIASSLLFVPRTALAITAGLVFGTIWGVVWAAIGSVLGAVAGFCLARYVNSGLIDLNRYARLEPLLDQIQRRGWRAVAVLRLIPVIPHSAANYGFGLTPIRLGPYALGSFVGQLPMTIACVDLGAAGEQLASGGAGWVTPTAIGAAALGLSLLVPAIARRWVA
jgi:uncharacterized membrane protein YdjX (TVP38/TMEM64 family)